MDCNSLQRTAEFLRNSLASKDDEIDKVNARLRQETEAIERRIGGKVLLWMQQICKLYFPINSRGY